MGNMRAYSQPRRTNRMPLHTSTRAMSYQEMLRELRGKITHEKDPEQILALVEQLLKLLAQKFNMAEAHTAN
jgi:hypothetical protein